MTWSGARSSELRPGRHRTGANLGCARRLDVFEHVLRMNQASPPRSSQ
ncbi:MAG: hypothetical protein AVDCRST_MAG21-7 [uncultured Nocardioidaceae bacterium]|uniref:Uncharacterized protein n=1 Tax=uncultured Nocardioidaceae bacterium TaxID=253824 RepID=A0A6J4MQU0_9ACTN|nr:MAG: hypothetical protein AVDCRST_MAG21-7 [uncultured Nocardioidaceae bacterium]